MIQSFVRKLRQHIRRRRYQFIERRLRVESSNGLILDLGGGPASFFSAMFPHPQRIILLDLNYNLVRRARRVLAELQPVVADGGRLPFADNSISVSVCNSVIEHVVDPDSLAKEIQRTSGNYFVQTPNGKFPLETHSLVAIPFYNLIPGKRLRRLACKLFGANFEYVNSVRYLSEQRLRSLFPNAVFTYERVLNLKKSFYVYRCNEASK